jgi:hypothetical protein
MFGVSSFSLTKKLLKHDNILLSSPEGEYSNFKF